MSARKLKVVLTRRLPDAVETRMRELFDAELNLKDQPMNRAALMQAVQRAEVLVPTITDVIDAELINGAGEQLKMIANFGAGVDHIDIDAAVARGIIVTNTPGVLTEDTADLAMSLILAVSRRIVEGAQVIVKMDGGYVAGQEVRYFVEDFPHREQPYTSEDGLWLAMQVPTGRATVEAYMVMETGGEPQLMGSTSLDIFPDSINISSIYVGHDDGVLIDAECLTPTCGADTDSDADTDADADTDTDSDTDADSDTDTSPGGDTGDAGTGS